MILFPADAAMVPARLRGGWGWKQKSRKPALKALISGFFQGDTSRKKGI